MRKLIRDNIPEIIAKDGRKAHARILDKDEYEVQLEINLKEEAEKYLESKDVEELADILEVVYALSQLKETSKDALEEIRLKKANKNGVFEKRLLLFRITV